MTSEPRQEVEVQGRVGEAVALPLGNEDGADHVWTLELPDEVEAVAGSTRLQVRAGRSGSYVLTATLADPRSGTSMTILPIRLTVA